MFILDIDPSGTIWLGIFVVSLEEEVNDSVVCLFVLCSRGLLHPFGTMAPKSKKKKAAVASSPRMTRTASTAPLSTLPTGDEVAQSIAKFKTLVFEERFMYFPLKAFIARDHPSQNLQEFAMAQTFHSGVDKTKIIPRFWVCYIPPNLDTATLQKECLIEDPRPVVTTNAQAFPTKTPYKMLYSFFLAAFATDNEDDKKELKRCTRAHPSLYIFGFSEKKVEPKAEKTAKKKAAGSKGTEQILKLYITAINFEKFTASVAGANPVPHDLYILWIATHSKNITDDIIGKEQYDSILERTEGNVQPSLRNSGFASFLLELLQSIYSVEVEGQPPVLPPIYAQANLSSQIVRGFYESKGFKQLHQSSPDDKFYLPESIVAAINSEEVHWIGTVEGFPAKEQCWLMGKNVPEDSLAQTMQSPTGSVVRTDQAPRVMQIYPIDLFFGTYPKQPLLSTLNDLLIYDCKILKRRDFNPCDPDQVQFHNSKSYLHWKEDIEKRLGLYKHDDAYNEWANDAMIDHVMASLFYDRHAEFQDYVASIPITSTFGLLAASADDSISRTTFSDTLSTWLGIRKKDKRIAATVLRAADLYHRFHRPYVQIVCKSGITHWKTIICFNPMKVHLPQSEAFSGFVILDGYGNCFEAKNAICDDVIKNLNLLKHVHRLYYPENKNKVDFVSSRERFPLCSFEPTELSGEERRVPQILAQTDGLNCGFIAALQILPLLNGLYSTELKVAEMQKDDDGYLVIPTTMFPIHQFWRPLYRAVAQDAGAQNQDLLANVLCSKLRENMYYLFGVLTGRPDNTPKPDQRFIATAAPNNHLDADTPVPSLDLAYKRMLHGHFAATRPTLPPSVVSFVDDKTPRTDRKEAVQLPANTDKIKADLFPEQSPAEKLKAWAATLQARQATALTQGQLSPVQEEVEQAARPEGMEGIDMLVKGIEVADSQQEASFWSKKG